MMDAGENIVRHFLQAAEAYPENIAIVHHGQHISYRELRKRVEETAVYFKSKGLQPGDRVLVFVPMSIDLYVSVLALLYMGATVVFLDEWVSRKRLALCCKIARCKGFIAPLKLRLLAYTSSALRSIPVWLKPGKHQKGENAFHRTASTDTALITFTTGSTGTPKAAKRTHGFLNAQFAALIDKINPWPNDVDMVALPIVLLLNLGAGCTSVIPPYKSSKPEKMDVKKITDLLIQYNVNRIESSPYFIKRIAHYVLENNLDLSTVKKIFTGGAPVFPNEAEIYVKAFPSTKIEIVYGSTEAEPISSILAKDLVQTWKNAEKGLCAGKHYHGTAVKIIPVTDQNLVFDSAEALQKTVLPVGDTGEIIVSGKHVLSEYFNNPEALKRNKIFIGNTCWHRTGDSGWFDEEGNLFLMGRCSGLIEKNGTYLSPFIYEYVLRNDCSIETGTVLGYEGKIIVVAEGEPGNEKQILEQLKRKGFYADEVKLLATIPRDPRHYSKIEYAKLAALVKS